MIDRYPRLFSFLLPLSAVILLLSFWQITVSAGWVNRALFPGPLEAGRAMLKFPELGKHLFHSGYRLLISVILGYIPGVLLAFLMQRMRSLDLLDDIAAFLMAIPGISWAPLFILYIGFGDRTILAVGALTSFFPAFYNVMHGLREIPREYGYLGRIWGKPPIIELLTIQLPAVSNYLLIGLKLAFARTWRTIIAVEMIAASLFGLGYVIFDARELLNTRLMFAGILLSGMFYMVIEFGIVSVLEMRTVRKWGMKQDYE